MFGKLSYELPVLAGRVHRDLNDLLGLHWLLVTGFQQGSERLGFAAAHSQRLVGSEAEFALVAFNGLLGLQKVFRAAEFDLFGLAADTGTVGVLHGEAHGFIDDLGVAFGVGLDDGVDLGAGFGQAGFDGGEGQNDACVRVGHDVCDF